MSFWGFPYILSPHSCTGRWSSCSWTWGPDLSLDLIISILTPMMGCLGRMALSADFFVRVAVAASSLGPVTGSWVLAPRWPLFLAVGSAAAAPSLTGEAPPRWLGLSATAGFKPVSWTSSGTANASVSAAVLPQCKAQGISWHAEIFFAGSGYFPHPDTTGLL